MQHRCDTWVSANGQAEHRCGRPASIEVIMQDLSGFISAWACNPFHAFNIAKDSDADSFAVANWTAINGRRRWVEQMVESVFAGVYEGNEYDDDGGELP